MEATSNTGKAAEPEKWLYRAGDSDINREHKREKMSKPLPQVPATKLKGVN